MKARTLITSLIAGSLVLGSSTLVYASQKSDCDRQQRMEQRMEKQICLSSHIGRPVNMRMKNIRSRSRQVGSSSITYRAIRRAVSTS